MQAWTISVMLVWMQSPVGLGLNTTGVCYLWQQTGISYWQLKVYVNYVYFILNET